MWWFLIISLLTLLYCIWQKLGNLGKKYPVCLPHLPILGSLPYMNSTEKPHIYFTKLKEKYGEIYAFWMGPYYSVVVNQFSLAKEVLVKKGKDFASRPRVVTTDILSGSGKGIAFSEYGPQWRMSRKLVHSTFSLFKDPSSQNFEKIICQEASSLCEALANTQGQSMDPALVCFLAAANVICQFCFSSSWKQDDKDVKIMMNFSDNIIKTVARDSLVDIFPWTQLFPNKELILLKDSVMKRNKLLEKKLKIQKEKFNIDSVNNLLDMLLKAKMNNNGHLTQEPEITDEHILMTVGDIFGAGVETTSNVVKWCIAYLLWYPQVKEMIQKEIDQKIGFTRTPVLCDRHQLVFLEATIREILRIRPVAPLLIPHVATSDSSIGEYTIPKGTRIYINLWSIHYDPTEWDEPEQFKPERFLDKNKEQLIMPTSSYFPFGSGPRICIGEFLARAEVFLFLSWILQRFDLEVPDDGELPSLEGKFGVVYQITPFKLKFKLRKAWREAQLSA
ncbi:steroid 17-alpha-hydroxylase/17,20 lyase [Phascolarctos cinereus]|uniref:Steroid 17-alpha-hydroxylase/17,20 lyase n=1 Tax=Phascolarctos cinereus TaxID=38626 RepID=A0A6P5IXE1_PHACI|nr:steroid 17-alpha-hydroxylase/17,20 lyase [Phascolarctos cinereus]